MCRDPAANLSCPILKNIQQNRNLELEIKVAGRSWADIDRPNLPPCVRERAGFMSPTEVMIEVTHPYASFSEAHAHLLPTKFVLPPYSAPALPFLWTLREGAWEKADVLELSLRAELEDRVDAAMGRKTDWLQDRHNQLVLLDTFFSALRPHESLCIFYAKKVPLSEDPRRVIVGVGRVTAVGKAQAYAHASESDFDSVLWERAVHHSIRPDFGDGFLMPYTELLEYAGQHPEVDPEQFLAFVPDEHFLAFSYATEHVTNEAAISALRACAEALKLIRQVVPGKWDSVQGWIDARLAELWRMRGPYPGLGAALSAFGLEHGTLVAMELEQLVAHDEQLQDADPWQVADRLLRADTSLPEALRRHVGPTLRDKWHHLPDQRRALLKLLSRFELTPEQATRYYVHEDPARRSLGIDVTDGAVLANPYLLYECDRFAPDPVQLASIDRGLFPDPVIQHAYPLPDLTRVDEAVDPRRVRAYLVALLERAADGGDTLRPASSALAELRSLEVQPALTVDADLMTVCETYLSPTVTVVELDHGARGYQLDRYGEYAKLIGPTVRKRAKNPLMVGAVPWRDRLDREFKDSVLDDVEELARTEKAAALTALFSSRVAVLVGSAGTGKTKLLKILCNEPAVKNGGVLLLAPTGKARVRMEQQIGISGAKTIAQFLLRLNRYDVETGHYHLSGHAPEEAYKTVVVDEASMLTEDMLAALLDGLKGVDRLILVGDPHQLPPIGAGRPFVDIVRHLAPTDIESRFPRVAPCFAELTVGRRQVGGGRDVLLAEWFSGRALEPGADEVWDDPGVTAVTDRLRLVQWEEPSELPDLLLKVLADEIPEIAKVGDERGFGLSVGGTEYEGKVFYWAGREHGKAGAAGRAEAWQILSPVRHGPHGVEAINQLLQTTFRASIRELALRDRYRKIPRPAGPEGIVWGDKVINVANRSRDDVWPAEKALKYVANGEIGIVVGEYRTQKWGLDRAPKKLEVEFASQPGHKYGFWPDRELGEDVGATLELAYALTVHKCQGSEFDLTLVVIPNPCWLLSRELLYTALTRQSQRVVVLHQGDRHDLLRYASDRYSSTARRITNMLRLPQPIEDDGAMLDAGLIHRTVAGDYVRSKSEVIIANLLHDAGIPYDYEYRLMDDDGSVRYPDFRIVDDDTGMVYYWEHLGMLRLPDYRARWERKLAWYRANGVLPREEGGGPSGTLLTTRDEDSGAFDSHAVQQMIAQVFEV